MNFSAICKNFCCLLALFMLIGCGELRNSSEKSLPNPPDPAEVFHLENIANDYAIVSLDGKCVKFTNAQGKELCWGKNQLGDPVWPPEGDMGYFEYRLPGLEPGFETVVPYSESFTIQTRTPLEGRYVSCSAAFHKNGKWVSELRINSKIEGAVTFYDNAVVELSGDNSELRVFFTVHEGESKDLPITSRKHEYLLEGSGKEEVRLSLVGDEIVTEGMAGPYTVTKTEYSQWDSFGEPIYTRTYEEGSKE